MMSKRLPTFLYTRIIKLAGIASALGMLSSCLFFGSGYTYALFIDNKLTTPIAYSYCLQSKECIHVIQGESDEWIPYISRYDKPSEKEMLESFDEQFYILICDKAIEFKRIRAVSPLIKHGQDTFEIVIDEKVVNTFCQKSS